MVLRTHKLDSERTASTALAVRIGVPAACAIEVTRP